MFSRRRLVTLATLAAAALAALSLAACGSGSAVDDETAVRDTISQFDSAVAARDWERVCDLFSSQGIAKIELDYADCQASFEARYPEGEPAKEPTEITKIAVIEHHATVIADGVGVLTLSFEDERWKLD